MSGGAWSECEWLVGGLAIPMPAPMPEVIEDPPNDWLATRRVADLTNEYERLVTIAKRWDTWAAAHDLRILDGRGPTTTYGAITRTLQGRGLAVAFGLMGMPGQPWHLFVTVARSSAS